jgi:hypothetical protein
LSFDAPALPAAADDDPADLDDDDQGPAAGAEMTSSGSRSRSRNPAYQHKVVPVWWMPFSFVYRLVSAKGGGGHGRPGQSTGPRRSCFGA